MEQRKVLGNHSEQLARKFLVQQGFTVVQTNFFCKQGEIDLIVKKNQTLVFVEVRSKSNQLYGQPFETINQAKQIKIRRTAQYYLYQNPAMEQYYCRFDVISIIWQAGSAQLDWICDAF